MRVVCLWTECLCIFEVVLYVLWLMFIFFGHSNGNLWRSRWRSDLFYIACKVSNSYLIENTVSFHCKIQPVTDVHENNRCLLHWWRGMNKYILWTTFSLFSVKLGGTCVWKTSAGNKLGWSCNVAAESDRFLYEPIVTWQNISVCATDRRIFLQTRLCSFSAVSCVFCNTLLASLLPCCSVHCIAFAILRKATVSFVMSVCPFAWNTSSPTGRIFMKFDIWVFFENLSGNLRFH